VTKRGARTKPGWGFRIFVVLVMLVALGIGGVFAWQFLVMPQQVTASAGVSVASFSDACQIDQAPAQDTSVPDGTVIGLLQLPDAQAPWPIRAGVDDANMTAGVGWYPQTAGPGELGNMAIVGLRLMSGGAFDGILNLNKGDTITIQTCTMRYTYTIVVAPRDLTIQPKDTWVLDPVPGTSGRMPTDAWLTLISNQDVLPSSTDRAVGFAQLTDSKQL